MRQLEKRTFTFEDVTLVISEANALIEARMGNLALQASEIAGEDPDLLLLSFSYPAMVAPVVEWHGMQRPSFMEFADLPGQMINAWREVVMTLNPHWFGAIDNPEVLAEQEKKV